MLQLQRMEEAEKERRHMWDDKADVEWANIQKEGNDSKRQKLMSVLSQTIDLPSLTLPLAPTHILTAAQRVRT